MRLITAHKILIASGLALFLIYAAVQAAHAAQGDRSALWGLLVALPVVVTLALYLRWLWGRSSITS